MNDATQAVRACWVVSSNDWKILFNVGPRFLQNWIISKNWQFACWYYQQCHPPSPSAIARAGVTWILSMKVCLFEQVTATPSISLRNLSIDGWDEGGWTLLSIMTMWQFALRCRWMNWSYRIWQCDNLHGWVGPVGESLLLLPEGVTQLELWSSPCSAACIIRRQSTAGRWLWGFDEWHKLAATWV